MRVLTALRRALTATSGPTRRCSCGDWKRHMHCK
jgi:hypothetical protein